MYQPVVSVYLPTFSASSFFLFHFVFFTFKSEFYTNHFDILARLILLRQTSNDNFLKDPLKLTIFKYEQLDYI